MMSLNTHNKKTDKIAARPEVKANKKISAIWLLPFLALLLGGYLTYQSVNEAGIMIQIHFSDGEGMIEGKTPVKYKGLLVGKVTSIQPDRRLSGVNVLVEMDPRAEQALKRETQFWLVKPQASLTRISGLDTILSGNYIGMQPGGGSETRDFRASSEPPLQLSGDDLLVQLYSEDPASISIGSPVYHRHITVGEVVRVQLDETANRVQLQLQIKSDYRHLVNESSRFWNVSGIRLNASLNGIDLQTESLATLIAGGIAFDSPALTTSPGEPLPSYTLFSSLKAADRGIAIELKLPTAEGLALNQAEIRYLGLPIGKIEQLELSQDKSFVTAQAYLDPALENLVGDDTQFWLIKPKISVAGIQHLDTMLLGYRIQFSPASQPSSNRSFDVFNAQPAKEGALQITLIAEDSYGTVAGDPVMYKGLTIGSVQSLDLNEDHQIAIEVIFNPKYKDRVKTNSRFYIHSALSMDASLQRGLSVKVQPVDTALTGGIALYQPAKEAKVAENGALLPLFSDHASAMTGYQDKPLEITLNTEGLDGLQTGALVYFREFEVGQIRHIKLLPDRSVSLSVAIRSPYQHLINDSTRFWRRSGIDFKANLSGIELKTSSIMSLALGGIAFETPDAERQSERTQFNLFADKAEALNQFVSVQLKAPVKSQLKEGNPVLYGGFEIGKIVKLTLAQDLNHLTADLHLKARYADSFTRESSLYWLGSGHIGLDGIRNPAALFTGDFIEVKPGAGARQSEFELLNRAPLPDASDSQLVIYLLAQSLGSINEGSPILYRQKTIGQVVRAELAEDGGEVIFQAIIQPEYSHLVRTNTMFWNASGIKADIGLFSGVEIQAESVSTILNGGIAMTTPGSLDAQPKANFGSRFTLRKKAP